MSYKKRKDPNGIKLNTNNINYNQFLINFNSNEIELKKLNEIFKYDLHKKLYKLGPRYISNKKLFPTIQKVCNHIIEHILIHKEEIYNFIESNKNNNFKNIKDLFQEYLILPYLMTGNKHMNHYKEFSEFISRFNFIQSEDTDDLILFRCMDKKEYEDLVNNGLNKSLSFSLNPSIPISYQYISTILDTDKKNVIIGCVFNRKDVIIHITDGKMSGEDEVLVRINSIPKMIHKLGEYGKNELIQEFGQDIIKFLPLSPLEINNGFNYIDCLVSKGFKINRIKKSTNQYKGSNNETHWEYIKKIEEFFTIINS
jgi:hypothetical protein